MSPYENQVVIITGGSSGIGRSAALAFAEKGARVLITGRRRAPLEAVAAAHLRSYFNRSWPMPDIEPVVL
jgi:NAD(P)-dependent dehydrogenase (short-subunit alcohol dehydrogenase family)